MPVRNIVKLSLRRMAVRFPRPFNLVWKAVYPALHRHPQERRNRSTDRAWLNSTSRAEVFERIFRNNSWGSRESVSGEGSTIYNTTVIRKKLPHLLERYEISTILDAPCGDYNWMRLVQLPDSVVYIGGEIVSDLIADLERKFTTASVRFMQLDIVDGPIPQVDAWLCRDVLFHLTFAEGLRILDNAVNAGVKYFISTTFDAVNVNRDIATGEFRFINLQKPPYGLPEPIEKFDDFLAPNPPQQLAIWTSEQLRDRLRVK